MPFFFQITEDMPAVIKKLSNVPDFNKYRFFSHADSMKEKDHTQVGSGSTCKDSKSGNDNATSDVKQACPVLDRDDIFLSDLHTFADGAKNEDTGFMQKFLGGPLTAQFVKIVQASLEAALWKLYQIASDLSDQHVVYKMTATKGDRLSIANVPANLSLMFCGSVTTSSGPDSLPLCTFGGLRIGT